MKILVLNWKDLNDPQAGGSEIYLYEISKRLVKKGHKVTWIVPNPNNLPEREDIDGVKIIRKGGRFSVYFHAFILYLRELKKLNFDVIIDNINGVPFFTPLYCKKPIIAVIHHIVGWKIFRKELPLPFALVGYLCERLIPHIYKNCVVITVSQSTRKDLEELGIKNEKITVVPNGISIENKQHSVKADEPTVIYLGRIKKYKRVDHIIKAFSIVKRKIPSAKLIIAGRGKYEKLKMLAKASDVSGSIKFVGEVSENEKIKLLQKAWIFVTTSEKEGWGITVIEANACGTPVIAYNVPGLRDSVKHGYNGLLVENGSIESLANAIVNLIENEKLREKLSKNAIKWAKRFSWDKSAKEFERILKRVVEKRL